MLPLETPIWIDYLEYDDDWNPVLIDETPQNVRDEYEMYLKKQKEKNISVPAWFCGHVHGDYMHKINGINFILVGSQTAYVPQLWDMPKGGEYAQRNLGTASEDLWDSVAIDIENKKINIFRFGAGNDRELEWE